MRPPLLLLASIGATPMLVMGLWSGAPGQADPEVREDAGPTLLAALPNPANRIWVRVSESTSLVSLASALGKDPATLSRLNEVTTAHSFRSGDWVVLEASQADRISQVPSLDPAQMRRSAPSGAALNPGRTAANLLAGREVRRVQAGSRALSTLAIKPTTSGGVSWPELPDFDDAPRTAPQKPAFRATWVWPTKGVFTSGYGWRWGRMHKGIDIANNVGTPIVSAQDGVVNYAGWSSGYGYLVEVKHPDGTLTRYAHNSKLLVRKGQVVAQGQRISLMGSTGRSTGPHLHFEVLPPGRGAINPLKVLPSRA
jgi:murein DD-endopeptidase MepM/ murein hydrolase activator NlpD